MSESAVAGASEALRGRFLQRPVAMAGLLLLAALLLVAVAAPALAPFDPMERAGPILGAPSADYWMGTDQLGRDLFSRVLFGARVSLLIGVLSVGIATTLGTVVGAVAGYAGGRVDAVLMRTVDLFLSVPRLVLLIAVVGILEPSTSLIVVMLGLTGWMGVSRLVRGQVLSIREREYVLAARALGYRPGRILLRQILPNVVTPVIVASTLAVGDAILAEAALSFLGLGPPGVSWGAIIDGGRRFMYDNPGLTAFPGVAIVLTVMAFNLVGDGLRDALDPRHA